MVPDWRRRSPTWRPPYLLWASLLLFLPSILVTSGSGAGFGPLSPLLLSPDARGGKECQERQEQQQTTCKNGFLPESYPVHGCDVSMRVRQVPGDGNCLFHAISAALEHAVNGTHPSLNLKMLTPRSLELRCMAVNFLSDDLDREMYLENDEKVTTSALLSTVAAQYNMTLESYIEIMRQPCVWGGGPEIVALVNLFRRPIHVYELRSASRRFCLRRMACFGSPRFNSQKALHILSADSRFPNIKPGRQLPNGNHFLALFPCENSSGFEGDDSLGRSVRGGEGDEGSRWRNPLALVKRWATNICKACEARCAEWLWELSSWMEAAGGSGPPASGLPRSDIPPHGHDPAAPAA